MSTLLHNILRAAASAMEIPVVICLLLLAFSVFSLGWWLAELLGERRHMNASLPQLLETMRSGEKPLPDCIAESGLLRRQKAALLALVVHWNVDIITTSGGQSQGTTAGENGSVLVDKDHAAAMTPEEMERLRQQEGLSGGEDLEKRSEVYYDARTGTYYIVPNAAGN